VWQLQRLAWKEGLLARLETGRTAAPVALPPASDWAGADLTALDYRRVTARGRYERAQALVFAGPVATAGGATSGYFVMNVLATPDGGRLLVHRGVIPMGMKDAAPPPPEGEVELVGLLRAPERAGWFTPSDTPERGSYFLRDPKALTPALGANLSPFYLDVEAKPGAAESWPRAGVGTLAPPNNHLSYAFTWFALAGVLASVFALWARRRA
jgi:surfeit locus 1 family protein